MIAITKKILHNDSNNKKKTSTSSSELKTGTTELKRGIASSPLNIIY